MSSKKAKDAPKAPDFSSYIAGFQNTSATMDKAYQDHLDWAKTQGADLQNLFQQVSGLQSFDANQTSLNAQADRARYDNVFVPAQDRYMAEVNNYGTEADQYRASASAAADAGAASEAARQSALANLTSYGIQPGVAYAGLDMKARQQEALAKTLAANKAASDMRLAGINLRGGALAIGAGLPGQSTQESATSANIGQAITGEGNAVAQTSNGLRQGAVPFATLGLDAQKAATGAANDAYQNRLNAYKATTAASQASSAGLGKGLGQLLNALTNGAAPSSGVPNSASGPGAGGDLFTNGGTNDYGGGGGSFGDPNDPGGTGASGGYFDTPVNLGGGTGGFQDPISGGGGDMYAAEGGLVGTPNITPPAGTIPAQTFGGGSQPQQQRPLIQRGIPTAGPAQSRPLIRQGSPRNTIHMGGGGSFNEAGGSTFIPPAGTIPPQTQTATPVQNAVPTTAPTLQQQIAQSIASSRQGLWPSGVYAQGLDPYIGNLMAGGMADGGYVKSDLSPHPLPGDTVPVMLNPHEYVIPKDVVMTKGTDFFDRLIDKTRNPAPKKTAVPTGA